jgi:hypothetical protein
MKKTNFIDEWIKENKEEQGDYACFAGFEKEVYKRCDRFADDYSNMDIYSQLDLFKFVTDLLEEQQGER